MKEAMRTTPDLGPIGSELDRLCVTTIRALVMDAVQKANSGHPGMPMGMAEAAYVLWTRFLKHNPANPSWPDRDRFVLSAGHGSMLLYSLLHLSGYPLPLEQIKQFRQWESMAPGHPERWCVPGVETTTGPLGQGFGNGVGMAIAERFLGEIFNRDGHRIVDHHTYAIVSDGDLMEGVGSECASLAGHLGLGKLIYLYDDNGISIEGSTDLTFTEDVRKRFEAYHWHVLEVDGHDMAAVDQALREAQAEAERPTLIMCHTHIGFGSPHKQDTASAHGEPLGVEEVRLTKEKLGWPPEPTFLIPEEVRDFFAHLRPGWAAREAEWQRRFQAYRQDHPDLAQLWETLMAGRLPDGWQKRLPDFEPGKVMATRAASGEVLQAIAPALPTLLGGSADLAPSNKTYLRAYKSISRQDFSGRNLHFGVREHAMGAILNGLALHGGIVPYGGTFLVFSDYMRPSVRLAAMMDAPVIYVFTHDSIFVGEDGPTHQPVEQLAALRAIPHLTVIRPADAAEAAVAWRVALERRQGPTALALTRQNVPVLDRSRLSSAEGLAQGAYVLAGEEDERPDLILIASGSEVHVALEARELLARRGVKARVVSMPSWELFEEQARGYREAVLPPSVPLRLAIEAGVPQGWEKYVGPFGEIIGLER
ncbi:MAG: transketolase, partial [Anaerolineae bacterium]